MPVARHKPESNQAASFVPASYLGDESRGLYAEYASEGEITSNLTVSSLLSKLDSVKVRTLVVTQFTPYCDSPYQDFLKEAESMRAKFEDKKNEVFWVDTSLVNTLFSPTARNADPIE